MESLRKLLLCIAGISCISFAHGQRQVDTLAQKDYMQLLQLLNMQQTKKGQNVVVDYLIKKAKKENNTKFLIGGYEAKSMIYEDENVIKYADSALMQIEKRGFEMYKPEIYKTKGDYFFNQKKYKAAINEYIKVAKSAKENNNSYYILLANHDLAIIKRLINEHQAALDLHHKSLKLLQSPEVDFNKTLYLYNLSGIANIHNDIDQIDSAMFYNKLGHREAIKLDDADIAKHFSINQGVSLFHKRKYKESLDSLLKYTPYFEKLKYTNDLPYCYYYTGKNLELLGDKTSANKNHKKVDSLFNVNKAAYIISRKSYLELIDHYKQKKELRNQLYYVNQLIKVDSILNADEIYLSKTIYKEYDIPNLKAEKTKLQLQMQQNEKRATYFYILGIIALLIVASLLIYQNQKRKIYEEKFRNLMNRQKKVKAKETADSLIEMTDEPEEDIIEIIEPFKNDLDINTDIVHTILSQLKEFESSFGFLANGITLNQLAETFETNGNYLSRIINHHYDTSFSNYLNKFRIDYFVHEATTNPSIAKYTIKAIAADMGFNNAESFAKSFYKFYGLKPSYFLRELEKTRQNLV
jgi:AraC-like DNA-binding protein